MLSKYESNIFVFDIETVPQDKLTPSLWEELERKVDNEVARTSEDREKIRLKLQHLNPAFGRILCIGILYKSMNLQGEWEEKSEVFSAEDESQVLLDFWRRLADFDARRTLFVSFNGLSFDVPFIIARSVALNLSPANQSFLDTHRYGKFPHFDACVALDNKLTLEAACETFGVDSPKTQGVKGSAVSDFYKQGKILEILGYCLRDVRATYRVFQRLQPFYVLPYTDERKAQKVNKLNGEITPIWSRSPIFKCTNTSCNSTFYPEDLGFCFVCGTPVCMNCRSVLDKINFIFCEVHFNEYLSKADDFDALGYRNEVNSEYTASFDKYTWEEYLNYKTAHKDSDFVPFEEVDNIPF